MSRDNFLVEEIAQLLDEVFNPDWTTKNCGREKCKQLLHAMHCKFPGNTFGDCVSGFMNVDAIKSAITASEEFNFGGN